MLPDDMPPQFTLRLAGFVVEFLHVRSPDATIQRRGASLILIAAISAVATLLYGIYLLVSWGWVLGSIPASIWNALAILGAFLLMCGVAIVLARRGSVDWGGGLWLVSAIAAILTPSYLQFGLPVELAMISLEIPILAAGVIFVPGMSLVVGGIIAVLETCLFVLLRPDVRHDMLAGAIIATLITAAIGWLFALVLEQTFHNNDALRQRLRELVALGVDLSRGCSFLLREAATDLRFQVDLLDGYLRLLQQEAQAGTLNDAACDALDGARLHLHNAASRTQVLLETSELQQFPHGPRFIEFSPSHLLFSMIHDYGSLAERKGLRFRCTVEPEVPDRVVGDPMGLRHALGSVLSNAVRYTPRGQIDLYAWSPDGDHWAIRITDTGPGIPRALLQRILEPFYQVAPSISASQFGFGMGLALARDLVEAMGGTLAIASAVESGTSATITVPRLSGNQADSSE